MRKETLLPMLTAARRYFYSGATRSFAFRKAQLEKLKQVLLAHEKDIYRALYQDLKKSPEEVYASELGLLLMEINLAIKNLHGWMRPVRTKTNLVNLPSSSRLYKDPLGVVLIVAPWNYPLQLLLIPLVGAIAGGNCAVLKPSELAPATASCIAMLTAVAFSPEYIQVIQGDGATVVPQMMNAFRFDHVFYTGSVAVGRIIYQLAAKDLVPVTLELGGKSPAIVADDAHLATAAKRIVLGKFLNVGQTCIAPDYLLVHASVKQALLKKMEEAVLEFYGEDASASYDYGKIINEERFDKLVGYLACGRVVFGGGYDRKKLFIAPTLLDQVDMESPLMKEEIFGPLLPVHSFTSNEEAMAMVQRNANPLALYLFTASAANAGAWINTIPFGSGCINNTDWQVTNHHLPFGGVGNSGTGAYHGKFSFDAFTRLKPVMSTPTWIDPSMKYPSFKGKLRLLKWFMQ